MAEKPPVELELVWEHDLVFGGRAGEIDVKLDSASAEGPSPMQLLAFGFAGCMAMDLVHVIKKGRHDFRGLKVDLTGLRAPDEPRRFIKMQLHFTVTGTVPDGAVQRAIDLSREKYCSVWHSMRQDIELTATFSVSPGV